MRKLIVLAVLAGFTAAMPTGGVSSTNRGQIKPSAGAKEQLARDLRRIGQFKEKLSKTVNIAEVTSRFADEVDDSPSTKGAKRVSFENEIFAPVLVKTRGAFDEDDDKNTPSKEYGKLMQGDMILNEKQLKLFYSNETVEEENDSGDEESNGFLPSRTGILSNRFRWPKRNGVVTVPYGFSAGEYSYDDIEKVRNAMNLIERLTCISFDYWDGEDDYLVFSNSGECSSYVGRQGGQQIVNLDANGCMLPGIILHELIHALGFTHMQSHHDRDNYVKIFWSNINLGDFVQFQKTSDQYYFNYNTPYDYLSVMHYDMTAFSKNNRLTIVPYDQTYRNIIGQREGLSKGDILRLNRMYEC